MARDYIGIRMGEDLRIQVEQAALATGTTLSEWIRMSCLQSLSVGLGGSSSLLDEGYAQGRALGFELVRLLAQEIGANMPATYEEAIARYPQLLNIGTMNENRDPY